MSKIKGRVLLIPVGQRTASEKFNAYWDLYPVADRAKQAKAVVELFARRKYAGRHVEVDPGSLRDSKDEGRGELFVDGIKFAEFTTFVPVPAPVAAASLFGGGR